MNERVRPVRAVPAAQPHRSTPTGRPSLRRRLADHLSGTGHRGIVMVPGVPDRDWPAHRAI